MSEPSTYFSEILDILDGREGEVLSSAEIENNIEENSAKEPNIIQDAVRRLITFGEITLVGKSQYGRITYTPSVDPSQYSETEGPNVVWKAYVAEDFEHRYFSGIFPDAFAAQSFLRGILGDKVNELKRVPSLNFVYSTEQTGFQGYGTHTVVIRCEPVRSGLDIRQGQIRTQIDPEVELDEKLELPIYRAIEKVFSRELSITERKQMIGLTRRISAETDQNISLKQSTLHKNEDQLEIIEKSLADSGLLITPSKQNKIIDRISRLL